MRLTIRKKKISPISTMHYAKLFFRTVLFLAAAGIYIYDRVNGKQRPLMGTDIPSAIIVLIWLIFIIEMILRFFPSKIESMGCQKQFARNYMPTGKPVKRYYNPREPEHSVLIVLISWLALNGVIYGLFFANIIDEGILILIGLAYSVCDMICILFFCPFQVWMMKNKCCGSCRIYNWDYAMMFTPFVLVRSWYARSLFAVAIVLLIVWEAFCRLHPERFYEQTNGALSCSNCREKLCGHKKSLMSFLSKQRDFIKYHTDSL
ncbi:MAG: hypothetical protein UIJ88_03195 [Anaerovoracaceae bacterium]|nr:hypothetical protein [Anaerovoracaceae bacterium]